MNTMQPRKVINVDAKNAIMQLLPTANEAVTAEQIHEALESRYPLDEVRSALNSLNGEKKIWKNHTANPVTYSTWTLHAQSLGNGPEKDKLLLNERVYNLIQSANVPVTAEQVHEALNDQSLQVEKVKTSLNSLNGYGRIWKYDTTPKTYSSRDLAKSKGEPVGITSRTLGSPTGSLSALGGSTIQQPNIQSPRQSLTPQQPIIQQQPTNHQQSHAELLGEVVLKLVSLSHADLLKVKSMLM